MTVAEQTRMSIGFMQLKIPCFIGILPHERLQEQEISLSVKLELKSLYQKSLKNREFDKEAAQIFDLERATIVRAQGASEDQKFAAKLTQSKTDSSSSFGIAACDDLSLTIDYFALATLCEKIARRCHFPLLETLALELLEEIWTHFRCTYAWIRIEKPAALPRAQCAFVEWERVF